MQVMYLGRAPRTKETLPDFLKWRRVTRRPLVFRGLTGSQRTPGFWGVTVSEGYPTDSPRRVVQCFYRNSVVCFQEQKAFVLKTDFFTRILALACVRESVRTRDTKSVM